MPPASKQHGLERYLADASSTMHSHYALHRQESSVLLLPLLLPLSEQNAHFAWQFAA